MLSYPVFLCGRAGARPVGGSPLAHPHVYGAERRHVCGPARRETRSATSPADARVATAHSADKTDTRGREGGCETRSPRRGAPPPAVVAPVHHRRRRRAVRGGAGSWDRPARNGLAALSRAAPRAALSPWGVWEAQRARRAARRRGAGRSRGNPAWEASSSTSTAFRAT